MITGFNTDILYKGVTYHVQTEDKGLDTPLILSLVYDGGTILASKRSSYNDLLAVGFNEAVLTERLQKQHKLMCAAVRAGRIEDLVRMTMKESANKQKGLIAQKQVKKIKEETLEQGTHNALQNEKKPDAFAFDENLTLLELSPTNQSKPIDLTEAFTEKKISDILLNPFDDEVIIEAVEIIEEIEEEIILSPDAVEIFTGSTQIEQISDNKLKIELLDEKVFKGGEARTLNILTHRGNKEKGLSGTQITVKILGASFRPLILHSKTNNQGIAVVQVQLPHFKVGRAAVLIRATNDGEEVEWRRVIQPG